MSISNIVLSHSNLSACYFPADVTVYGNLYTSGSLQLDGDLALTSMSSESIQSSSISPPEGGVLLAQASAPVNAATISTVANDVKPEYFGSMNYISLVAPPDGTPVQQLQLSGLDVPAGATVAIVVAPTSNASQTLNVMSGSTVLASIGVSAFGKKFEFITFGGDVFVKVVYG